MSRYIEVDYLLGLIKDEDSGRYGYIDASDINNAPIANVVSVVRCKDCKFFREHLSMNCVYHVSAVGENWFCSQGKVTE